MILAVLLQTTQVDLAPTDPAITVTRSDSTYSVAVTNNTTNDIAGLAVAWLAGGPPRTLILDSKQPVVPAKGTVVLTPPAINPIPTDRTGRRLANPSTLDQTYRIVIEVDAVLFDDGHLIGRDSYGLVANITARTELATAEAKWAAKKPQVYEFTYKQICFCPPPPPGTPGYELIVFRVINGVGYLTGAWADRPQARQGLDKFSAVEKQ